MKKQFKLLLLAALVLVAVMAFTVLVSASTEAPTGDVTFTEGTHFFKVSISDVNYYYADLAAAVTDVPEGGTVTQLAAVDYSACKGTGSSVVAYVISGDKSYTLDGAGFTIKTPTGKGLQISGSTATAVVTLQNAVLSGAGGYCLDTNASGTVKLINCSLTATHYVIHVRKAGTLWLADDAKSSTDKNTLTATSTSTSEGYAAVAVGSGAVGAALLSDNATITMPAANGILLNGAASVTLNSGTTILGCASRQTIYIGCANTDLYKITVNGGSYQGQSFLNTNKACNYEVEVNDVDLSEESFTYGIRVNGANAKMKITLKNFKINASSYTVYVQKAADLTLVLDGSKMLSATKNVVYVEAASTLDLQLKNGSMLSADTSHTVLFAVSTTATLTLDDTSKITSAYAGTSEFNGGTIMVKATTTLTLRGTGVIENTATGSYAHVIHVYDAPGKLVMQGCTLSTNGTGADKNGAVILHGAGNVLEMTGGTINGKATQAVFAYVKASISISGGSLVSTGQSPIKTTADAGTSINISGGSFEAPGSMPVLYLYPSGTAAASATNPGTVTVTGGTFYSVKPIVARGGTWNMDVSGATALTTTKSGSTVPTYLIEVQDDAVATVTLGNGNNVAANKLVYVRENKGAYASVTLTGGSYAVQTTVLENANPTASTLTLSGGTVELKGAGSELYKNASTGTVTLTATAGTIKLYAGAVAPIYPTVDMTGVDIVVCSLEPTIVLDTAGTAAVASINDLMLLATGAIYKNKEAYRSITVSCEEQLTWIPVQIKHPDAVLKITGGTYSADAGNLITITAGALHISGGSFTAKSHVVYCAANADCSVEIAGGTLTSTAASPLYVRGSGNATVQISGGTLTAATAYPVLYFYGGGTASTLLVSGGSFYGKYLVQVRCAILESVTVRNVSFTAVKAGSDTKPAGVIYLNDDNATVAEIGLLTLENVSFALQENLIYYNKQLTPIRLCGEGEYVYTVTVKNCNGTAAKIGEFPAGVEAVDLTVADSVIKCSSYAINFGIQSSYAHKVLLSNADISTTGRGVLILRGAPDIKGFVTIEGNKTKLTAASNALGLIYGTDTGCYDVTVTGGTLLSPTSAPIVMRGEIAMTLHISGGRLQFATTPYESDVPVSGSVCGGVLVHTGTNTIDTLFPDTFTVEALTVLSGYGIRSISSTLEMAQDAKIKYGNTVYYAYIKLLPTSETYDPTNTDTASIGAALDLGQNAANSGIRFTTVLSTEMIALASAAKKAGKQVSYGTLIAPADYVTAAGAFTVEALAALDPLLSTVTYVKIPAVHTLRENASGDAIAFSGTLVKIKEKNFDRVFAGVAYVEIDGVMHYGSFDTVTNARSVRHLAAIALGKSSSYSDEKLALLRTYAKLPLMTDYSIVYNANTSVYMQEQVVSFSQRLSSITGTSHRVSPVSPTAPLTHERGKEILIGNTNRAETAKAMEMLGTNQYGIFRVGAKIVVLGTNERLTNTAMELFISTYLDSAPGDELQIETRIMTDNTPVMELTADYHVIYSALMDDVTRAGITVGRNNEENKDYNYDYPALAATKIYAHAVASGVALPVENLHDDSTAATKEIVVGLCTHSSTALLAEIDVDQYSIKIENGKIYIAALNDAALRAATARFMGMITDGITVVDGKIKVLLPSSYQFTHQLDTKFVTDFPRPAIKGLTLSGSQDVYDDAMLFYYTGGTALGLQSVRTYCATLEANGYTKMTENKADQNLFVTYKHTAKAQLLHVMYMPYPYADSISGHEVDVEPCLRIISAPLNVYTEVPQAMLTQNLGYTKVTNSRITAMTMNWMENTEENLPVRGYGNPYIVTLEDGSFIVIDGGFDVPADRERLVSVLHALHEESTGSPVSADNPLRIAAWLLTHEHTDHYRLFNWFAKEYGKSKEVKIGYVIGNFPSDEETFNATDVDTTVRRLTRSDFLTYTSNGGMQYIKVHTGQKLYIANAELEVLFTHEDLYPTRFDRLNDTSTVVRMTLSHTDGNGKITAGASVIWQGDSQQDPSNMIRAAFGSYLRSDMIQISHHGNNGDRLLTEYVAPTAVFIPQWLQYTNLYNHVGEYNKNQYHGWGATYYVTTMLSSVKYVFVNDLYNTTITIDENGANYELRSSSNPNGIYSAYDNATMTWSTTTNKPTTSIIKKD